MKYKRKLKPFLACEIASTEKWLCDMAQKGLIYESSGVFTAKFKVSEPCGRRYRLEYADVVASRIKDEKREMYEECGWQAADDYAAGLVVVYTDDGDASELYSEPALNIKPLEEMRKKSVIAGIVFIILALLTRLSLPTKTLGYSFVYILLQYGTIYYAALCLMVIVLFTAGVLRLIGAHRLKNYIAELAKDPDAEMKPRKKNAIKTALLALTIPMIVLWAVHLAIEPWSTTYLPADMTREYPFLLYEDVNPEEYNALINGGFEYHDCIHEKSDILAPSIIDLWQDAREYQYHVIRYEMRNEKLAEKLYEGELIDFMRSNGKEALLQYVGYIFMDKFAGKDEAIDFLKNDIPEYKTSTQKLDGADICYVEDDNNFMFKCLLIREDNVFTKIIYCGDGEVRDLAPLYLK